MTFPLGSANLLLRLCELWFWGESIVNQHNNSSRISPAGASASLDRGKAVHQMTAHPEHTHRSRHIDTLALFYSLSLSFLQRQTQKFTDLTKSHKRGAEERQNLAKGSLSVSSSSLVSLLHQRCARPIRFSCQSGNTFSPQTHNCGSFKA